MPLRFLHGSVEDQGFKVILSYIRTSRLGQAAGDPLPKQPKQKAGKSPQVARVCLGPMALFFYVHNFALLFSQLKIKSTHAI